MKELLYQKQWKWRTSGVALGLLFLITVAFVKPIGVSTQFVILDGMVWDLFSGDVVTASADNPSGYASSNAYLNKSGGKYAASVANPLNYSLVFVIAMVLGGFIAKRLQHTPDDKQDLASPPVWRERFGESLVSRYVGAFIGGVLVLFGARLAGGCTSGHMMSGMMQTSVSGYLFAMGAFCVAVPVAIFMFRRAK